MSFPFHILIGDRGYKDEDGYIWFVGRSDDVIISSGYRIGPFEVESVLIEHPKVAESAVVSSPCEVRGEVVKAFVVLSEEFTGCEKSLKQELQEHVKNSTAPYKYPRKVKMLKFVELIYFLSIDKMLFLRLLVKLNYSLAADSEKF